jgi:hypothetical protein
VDLNKLTMGDKIVAGTGIGLFISLLFFPWHNIDFGFGASFSRSGVQSPNAIWGWLALLLAIALAGSILAEKLGGVSLPDLPVPWHDARFYGAIAVIALLLLKLLLEFDFLGFGAWLSILLGAGMAYGGFLIKQEGPASTGAAPPSAF